MLHRIPYTDGVTVCRRTSRTWATNHSKQLHALRSVHSHLIAEVRCVTDSDLEVSDVGAGANSDIKAQLNENLRWHEMSREFGLG